MSTLTPHPAAAAIAATKMTLIRRPERSLLLQPWSTKAIQTTNRMIAATARVFVHMTRPLAHELDIEFRPGERAQVTRVGDSSECCAHGWDGCPALAKRRLERGTRRTEFVCNWLGWHAPGN